MGNLIPQSANTFYKFAKFLFAFMIMGVINTSITHSIPILDLKSTSNFVILAGSTVTGLPPVNIVGNVGLSPAAGSNVSGFDGTNVDGILYVVDASGPSGSVIDASILQTAKSDLTIAYNDAAGRTPVPTGPFLNPGSGNLGGLNIVPGLYKFTSNCQITGADLTLTGNATDVWIFQISTSLNLGSNIKIILAGGAKASNIFWQVGSSATLGTYSTFQGTIFSDQSVSLGTGATLNGRALAFSAAVTMESGVTTNISRRESNFPIFSSNIKKLNFGNVTIGSSKLDSVEVTNIGSADLIIKSVIITNEVFTITPSNKIIKAGSTSKYYITFSPNLNDAESGRVIFTHNAAIPNDTIIVSGTGENMQNIISIKDAKKLPLGTEFIVEGIITRTLGSFTRFQDETSGLTIIQSSGQFYENVANNSLQNGDKISIKGKISEVNNLKVIKGIDLIEFSRISRNNNSIVPIEVTLLNIKNNGELYESRLIKLVNIDITDIGDTEFMTNKSYQISDDTDNSNTVSLYIGGVDNSFFVGQQFYSNMKFEGILSQSGSNPNMGYLLTPILTTDLVPIGTGINYEELVNNTNLENYPNPFTNSTKIQYNLTESANVNLTIIDLNGNEISTLVNENQVAGFHQVELNLSNKISNLPSGIYYNKLNIEGKIIINQMQIIK